MNTLKSNLRQEHWESLSWASTCHQLLTPWQMATLLVETHPQWCVSLLPEITTDLHISSSSLLLCLRPGKAIEVMRPGPSFFTIVQMCDDRTLWDPSVRCCCSTSHSEHKMSLLMLIGCCCRYDLCALSTALEEKEMKGESRVALPAPASPL